MSTYIVEHGMNIYVTSGWFFKNSKRLISNSTLTNVVLGPRILPFWDILWIVPDLKPIPRR
jgi:hypothetical protein